MQDSHPPMGVSHSLIWATFGPQGSLLAAYPSLDAFKTNTTSMVHNLRDLTYLGTGHVIYHGALYIHLKNTPTIARIDLDTGEATANLTLKDSVYYLSESLPSNGFLFTSKTAYVQFMVDENGLWVLYGNSTSGNLTIAMLEPKTLDIIKQIDVGIKIGSKGGAMIVCGQLYTLRHHDEEKSYFDTQTDLWQNTASDVQLSFTNPFKATSMMSFLHQTKVILTWDSGNLLRTPLVLEPIV